jgi:hypothetical protein
MGTNFNFLNQPILSALSDAAHLLPGLQQVDLLYSEHEKSSLQMMRVKANDDYLLENIPIDRQNIEGIIHFKNDILGTRWYDPDELPFSETKMINRSHSIFDEILKSVLCIGFPSSINSGHDVFIFYFREDASEFGPMRDDKVLETTQKIVIERLLQSSLKAILNNYSHNRKAMAELNKNIHGLLSSKQQKIEEQEQELLRMTKEMDDILNGILSEVKNDGEIIRLSDAAKSILRPHLSNIPLVKNALQNAVNFSKTISFGLMGDELILHDDYFSDLVQKPKTTSVVQVKQADEYSANTKMYRFLDSLEQASKDLTIKGMKLTSSNVGSVLESPITAAAISDKLKNHSKKINLLLQQYPDNWKTIRHKFRPIVNIQERASENRVA